MLAAIAKVVGLIAAGLALSLVFQGVVWLVFNMWWLPVLLTIVLWFGWLVHRHPGVQTRRTVRAAVQRGDRQKVAIAAATTQTKARMNRVARDWTAKK